MFFNSASEPLYFASVSLTKRPPARLAPNASKNSSVFASASGLVPFFFRLLARCFGLLVTRLFHLLAQTQRAHVSPDLFDVCEAFGLRARLARIVPPERILAVGGPNRILLFVIDDDLVDGCVFSLIQTHRISSFPCRSFED